MSVSKWKYEPFVCDGQFCVGDCDLCTMWRDDSEDDEGSEQTE